MKVGRILDCTLRDGGYYTNWDFESSLVDTYLAAVNQLPIDYIEVGYRNLPQNEYMGEYGYCPVSTLRHIRKQCSKKIAVMLNEKSTKEEDLEQLLSPIEGLVEMVRLAVDPKNFDRALGLAKAIKERYEVEVAFNVMYMSTWEDGFYEKLYQLNGIADLFCMVDSYGSIAPSEARSVTERVKAELQCQVGFHGHNNLQMGLINTLTAIECGVDFVDATVLGMGRGAGNLNIELLLTYLNKHENLSVNFNVLGDVVKAYQPLFEQYRWGTQLPYIISGANSIPQKEVMEMVTNRVFSFNSVVRGLQNRIGTGHDTIYPVLPKTQYDNVIIIGGGPSPITHLKGLKTFIKSLDSVAIVFATARHAAYFKDVEVAKYYCLSGQEGKRLSTVTDLASFKDVCVLSPSPRKFGTDVPELCRSNTYELETFTFTQVDCPDSCTTISIQLAIDLNAAHIYIAGYDGYPGKVLSERDMALNNENNSLFRDYKNAEGHKLIAITPSAYDELEIKSIYQLIQNL